MWTAYDRIGQLPTGLWDRLIARGEACLDARLVAVAEEAFPDAPFRYFVKEEAGEAVALFMAMVAADTPFYSVEPLAGQLFRTASTGTPETTGLHFWYDPRRFTLKTFLDEASAQIRAWNSTAEALVFRDFPEEMLADTKAEWEGSGFTAVRVLDVTHLEIAPSARSFDDHAATLKYKYRYQLAQYREALDPERYETLTLSDFLPYLDELYPLYVDVSRRASEYAAPPYPAAYFHTVKRHFGDDAAMTVIRERATGRFLGFMLVLYTKESCVHQYIGFDRIDELYLWYNLTVGAIDEAIRRRVFRINMGVTNAVSKHKFGARSTPTATLVTTCE